MEAMTGIRALCALAICSATTAQPARTQSAVWFERLPITKPSARYSSPLAFDEVRGRVVMFGGWTGSANLDDTWEYDGANWTQRTPSVRPPPRHGHALMWDPASQRTLLFGGWGDTAFLGDTWTWDGTDWSVQSQGTPAPSPRGAPAVGCLPSMPGVLMLGGQFGPPSSSFVGDFWLWDGGQWLQLAATTPVGPRSQSKMAYDPSRGGMVLVGGHSTTPSRGFYNDTWFFDGSGWSDLSASVGTYGQARSFALAGFVPDRDAVVLFGGYTDPAPLGDTWELTASGWRRLAPSVAPSPREAMGGVLDPVRGTVVCFGGFNRSAPLDGTWEYGEATPPATQVVGTGCSWGGATPKLVALRPPWRGELLTQLATGLPAFARNTPFLLVGLKELVPVDLSGIGAPGCRLYLSPTDPLVVLSGVNVGGAASWSFRVPALATGGTFACQAAVLEPAANPLGVAFSNGVALTLR